MKKEIHPEYRDVLFVDSSTGTKFVIGSNLATDEKETFEGKEYPLCRVSVSSASHPFFTGSSQFIDTEGRVDKFTKRYQKKRAEEKQQQEKKQDQEDASKKKKKKK